MAGRLRQIGQPFPFNCVYNRNYADRLAENDVKRIPKELLIMLADGRFHSGDALGKALGISRAAVWKQLQKLEEMQLQLESVKGKGYRLRHGLDFLDSAKIAGFTPGVKEQNIVIHDELDSSNAELLRIMQQSKLSSGHCILTEMQHSGRGRRGRQWLSPYGCNIYLSMLWRFERGMAALDGLSLVVGLAVAKSVYQVLALDVQLKWPNDVLYRQRKLAGILLEVVGDPNGLCDVVIGIGVNVNWARQGQGQAAVPINQPWTSLLEINGNTTDRNHLTGVLIERLERYLTDFDRHGFLPFADAWAEHDAYRNSEVMLELGERHIYGLAAGVNNKGELLIETEAGQQAFNAGEVSLRLAL